jgi:hypothetical protein
VAEAYIHGLKSGGRQPSDNIHGECGARAYILGVWGSAPSGVNIGIAPGRGALPPEADKISAIQILLLPKFISNWWNKPTDCLIIYLNLKCIVAVGKKSL